MPQTLSARIKAIPTDMSNDGHACPMCGVFVPEIRTALTGELVCVKCHVPKPILIGTRSTYGGGNERVHRIIRMA